MHEPFKNCKWIKYPIGDTAQNFGENKKLYKDTMGWEGGHNGWDGVRPHGEHLFAVESGVVCDVKDDAGGYGKHIRILCEYEKGKYREWTYGHLHLIAVKLGQKLKEGQFVGLMGNTGFVVSGDTVYWTGGVNKYQGTHLHLNVREVVKDASGWKYPYPESPKVRVLNHGNGTKGGVDPIPYFFPTPKARMMRDLAEKKKSTILYQFAEILKITKS
jgi:murein DD-endopeptidase MepM/ murein hydrolase activator NlpD